MTLGLVFYKVQLHNLKQENQKAVILSDRFQIMLSEDEDRRFSKHWDRNIYTFFLIPISFLVFSARHFFIYLDKELTKSKLLMVLRYVFYLLLTPPFYKNLVGVLGVKEIIISTYPDRFDMGNKTNKKFFLSTKNMEK